MARELLLLRHGKSDWGEAEASGGALADFDRPLKKRGLQDAKRLGRWLRKTAEWIPDHVVSSPARRARDTALELCAAAKIPRERIRWDDAIYENSVKDLLGALARCPEDAERVLLIGHNPALESLVLYLAADAVPMPEDGKLMPTAALARLELPDDWARLARGSARLLSITRPADLE